MFLGTRNTRHKQENKYRKHEDCCMNLSHNGKDRSVRVLCDVGSPITRGAGGRG